MTRVGRKYMQKLQSSSIYLYFNYVPILGLYFNLTPKITFVIFRKMEEKKREDQAKLIVKMEEMSIRDDHQKHEQNNSRK